MSLLKGLQNDDILSKQDETYTSAFLGADLELDGSRRRQVYIFKVCFPKSSLTLIFFMNMLWKKIFSRSFILFFEKSKQNI